MPPLNTKHIFLGFRRVFDQVVNEIGVLRVGNTSIVAVIVVDVLGDPLVEIGILGEVADGIILEVPRLVELVGLFEQPVQGVVDPVGRVLLGVGERQPVAGGVVGIGGDRALQWAGAVRVGQGDADRAAQRVIGVGSHVAQRVGLTGQPACRIVAIRGVLGTPYITQQDRLP